jgi:hypothetical protein
MAKLAGVAATAVGISIGALVLVDPSSGQDQALAVVSPTPVATTVPVPTALPPTPTPEPPLFVLGGVYRGTLAGGAGEIVIMPLPNGMVLMEGARVNIPCEDGTRNTRTGFYHYNPYFRATYTATTITADYTGSPNPFRFNASLTDANTLTGTTWVADRVIAQGGPVCSPGEVSFAATLRGTGKQAFAREMLAIFSSSCGRGSASPFCTTEGQIKRLESFCRCTLPD